MDAILSQSVVRLTRNDAERQARRRIPLVSRVVLAACIGSALFASGGKNGPGALVIVATVSALVVAFVIRRSRAAHVEGWMRGADETHIRYAVTDSMLSVDEGDVSLTAAWSSVVGTTAHPGDLRLRLRGGGAIGIPIDHAPPELMKAIDDRLKAHGISEPAPQPAFRRAYAALFVILALLLLTVSLNDSPPNDLCDQNPGLEYWDSDGWHRC